MNTYHKWLSGRSRKERCFKQVICFEPKNVSHVCNIYKENGDMYLFYIPDVVKSGLGNKEILNMKMETCTFLIYRKYSNLALGDKEILKRQIIKKSQGRSAAIHVFVQLFNSLQRGITL